MNSTDRAEFDSQLAVLCAGMDVPCTQERKEAYWKGLQRMSLSIFVRTVEYVLAQETWIRIPKPGQLWEVSRRMRAAAPPPPPKDDGFRGDDWDIQSNLFLLAHIRQRLAIRSRDPYVLGNEPRLIAAKKAWAADMRDVAINGEVDPAFQKVCWHDYIAQAEKAINT